MYKHFPPTNHTTNSFKKTKMYLRLFWVWQELSAMLCGYKVPKSENELFSALDRTWFTLDKFYYSYFHRWK
jgi:hypothetical protein